MKNLNRGAIVGVLPVVLIWGCATGEPAEFGHITAQRAGDLSLGSAPKAPFDAEHIEACAPGGLTELGVSPMVRRPYLHRLQARSASLMWTSRSDTGASVAVSAGKESRSASAEVDPHALEDGSYQYSVELSSLEPQTLYCYEVRGPDGTVLASAGFKTAPLPDTAEPVQFVAFGDSGEASEDQAAVIRAMQGVPLDLLLNTGDLAGDTGTFAELEETFFQPYASFLDKFPMFAAIGNHEYGAADGAAFRRALPTLGDPGAEGLDLWYSVDWGNIHFVVLDTNRIVPEQLEWLEQDLSANELPWTVVILHHAPFSSGHHGGNDEVRQTMVPIFEAHRVPLVLVGHDHHYERTRSIHGVTYIVTGGGGRGTRAVGESDFTAFSARAAHFVHGHVSGSEMRLFAIDGAGREFDSVAIRLDE